MSSKPLGISAPSCSSSPARRALSVLSAEISTVFDGATGACGSATTTGSWRACSAAAVFR